jgi:hypothetical protein
MADRSEERQVAIDGLYSLPLAEFTSARDELARELRRGGDRDGAGEVKRLRKPSVVAWALNQVSRADRAQAQRLIEAGARLREAQQRLLAGEGREPFQQAAADERRLVDELAQEAERELGAAGQSVSATVAEKLRATLHAAATDAGARAEFLAGRVVRDYEPTGLGPLPDVIPSPRTRTPARPPKEVPGRSEAARARALRQLEQHLERARTRQRALEEKREEAERRLREARTKVARAASELERAEAAEEGARGRAEEAAEAVSELERELRERTPGSRP